MQLDTAVKGRQDAFNPAELLLAAIAACMIKGIRQDSPPFMTSISYELIVDTDEVDRRLELLHQNVRKYGTISNTVAAATKARGQDQSRWNRLISRERR